MVSEKMTMAERIVMRRISLSAGLLLSFVLTAGFVFAADASSVTDGRDVEITYLNGAAPGETLLVENASEETMYFAAVNTTDIDSSLVRIQGVEDQTWTGNEILLDVKILKYMYNYWIPLYTSDYELFYSNNVNPGTASVTIKAKERDGGLSGSVTKYFQIRMPKTNMGASEIEVTGVKDQTWTGNAVALPDLKVCYKKDGVVIYQYPADQYTVSYNGNINAGTASVTITGKDTGNDLCYGLTGSVTHTFQIVKPAPESETPQKESETPQESGGLPVSTEVINGSGASRAVYMVTGADSVTYTETMAPASAKTIKIPDTVVVGGKTYKVTAVEKKAFSGRKKLKKVTIGANVTTIGASAFAKCSNLKTVTIGAGVTTIGANAFSKCSKLKTLTIKSASLIPAKCKKCLKGSSVTTVKVPKSVKKMYKKKIFTKKVCGKKVTVK